MYFILFQLLLCNSTFIQFPVQNFISESLFFYFFLFITEDYQLVKLYFLSTRDSILYQMQYACLIRTWLLDHFYPTTFLVSLQLTEVKHRSARFRGHCSTHDRGLRFYFCFIRFKMKRIIFFSLISLVFPPVSGNDALAISRNNNFKIV